MSASRLVDSLSRVRESLKPYALGLTLLVVLAGTALVVGSVGARRSVYIAEDPAVVEWDHRTEAGAILHITATAAQAAANNMTLREWVNQLLEWFPPIVASHVEAGR